jgi:hypothetical protein
VVGWAKDTDLAWFAFDHHNLPKNKNTDNSDIQVDGHSGRGWSRSTLIRRVNRPAFDHQNLPENKKTDTSDMQGDGYSGRGWPWTTLTRRITRPAFDHQNLPENRKIDTHNLSGMMGEKMRV